MSKISTLTLSGTSGKKHSFDVYSINSNWNEVAAVYAVTKREPEANGAVTHSPIYVGQTENLKERHSNHHKAECFKARGGNCLCVLVTNDEEERLAIEADLLDAYTWPCNG